MTVVKQCRYINQFCSLDINVRIIMWRFYCTFQKKVFTIDDLERFRREYGLSDTSFYEAVKLMRYLEWYKIRADDQGHAERYWSCELNPQDFNLTF